MIVLTVFVLSSCSARESAEDSFAGLRTEFDSTDAVISARVSGDIPDDRARKIAERWRLAPQADDTTLFSDVWHGVDVANNVWVGDVATGRLPAVVRGAIDPPFGQRPR